MTTARELKLTRRVTAQQQGIVGDLQSLVEDIGRCEKTITALKNDLEGVNAKHGGRQTTQEDIAYLEDLLSCARKKLVWEKQMASLQKRTPALMARVEALVNHPQSSPDENTRTALLESLKGVQSAMQRLNALKL